MMLKGKRKAWHLGAAVLVTPAIILAGVVAASPAMAASSVFGKMTPWGCSQMDVSGSSASNFGNTARSNPFCVGTAGVGVQLKRGGVLGQRMLTTGTYVSTVMNGSGAISGYHTGWGIAANTWHIAGTLYS